MTQNNLSFDLGVDISRTTSILRCFRFISKGIACISPGRWKFRRYLEWISLLTNTNNPPFLVFTSNLKEFLIPGKRNWLSGNEESSFLSAIANISKLSSIKWGILENFFRMEFILRYADETHLGDLTYCFLVL